MSSVWRTAIIIAGLTLLWYAPIWMFDTPHYILPAPHRVLQTWYHSVPLLAEHALTTMTEIVLGLLIGAMLGMFSAVVMVRFRGAHRWLMPVLVISQALPVFALAPILVLWLGYGLASKVAMAVLIIYFPVTAACYDGMRHANPGWLDLAHSLGADDRAIIRYIRFPAALPALASGLRIAASVAPIGAVVGEWVGSSRGLGYLMLHANARMQIDLMFAALLTLAVFALCLYFALDKLLSRVLYWQPKTLAGNMPMQVSERSGK